MDYSLLFELHDNLLLYSQAHGKYQNSLRLKLIAQVQSHVRHFSSNIYTDNIDPN